MKFISDKNFTISQLISIKKFKLLLGILTIITFFICINNIFPPNERYLAGTDSSNYFALIQKLKYQHKSSKYFLSDQISSVVDKDFGVKKRESKKIKGLMTPFVFVGKDNTIKYPHFHMSSYFACLFELILPFQIGHYFNSFILLIVSLSIFFYSYPRLKSFYQSVLISSIFLTQADIVRISRDSLSEISSMALLVALFFSIKNISKTKKNSSIPLLILSFLSATRAEYLILSTLSAFLIGAYKIKFPVKSKIIFYFSFWLIYLYQKQANEFHIEAPAIVLISHIGLFAYLFELFGQKCGAFCEFIARKKYKLSTCISIFITFTLLLDVLKQGSLISTFGFQKPRYSTISLLLGHLPALLILGFAGIFTNSKNKIFELHHILYLPLLIPLIHMFATPVNEYYWTRRFIPFIIPILSLGIFQLILKTQKKKFISLALIFILVISFSKQLLDAKQTSKPPLRKDIFLSQVTKLNENDYIFLDSNDQISREIQLPLRSLKGTWSYLLWNKSIKLQTAIKKALEKNDVYVGNTIYEKYSLKKNFVKIDTVNITNLNGKNNMTKLFKIDYKSK